MAGTVSIEVVPQDPDIGDAVGIIANLTLAPGETCTKMECRLKDLTCGYERGPFTMFQDSPTRWHGNWQTLDGHNGPWEIKVTAYFSTYNPPGSSQATAVKLVTVRNLVLSDLIPPQPILYAGDTPVALSCYVSDAVPLNVGMEVGLFDADQNNLVWSDLSSVPPDTTWLTAPPLSVPQKYHIYTYKFYGQQNYADWYTNPRPIFDTLSANLGQAFDPDTGEMLVDLEYRLNEKAGSLDWKAYHPLLDELSATNPPAGAMPTQPAGSTLYYYDADVQVPVPPHPVYGGRYHWVVSGMASKMERDHVFLPIKDEGTSIVMQPRARNFNHPDMGLFLADMAAAKQNTLVTEVPEGVYAATGAYNPQAAEMKAALVEAAIWYYAGHGWSTVSNGYIQGSGDSELWASDPGTGDPDHVWVSGSGGVQNATQCHLGVVYACLVGTTFGPALNGVGVDCVAAATGVPWTQVAGDWSWTFWEQLRVGANVGDALKAARDAVYYEHGDYWGTDSFRTWPLSATDWVIVYARYE